MLKNKFSRLEKNKTSNEVNTFKEYDKNKLRVEK